MGDDVKIEQRHVDAAKVALNAASRHTNHILLQDTTVAIVSGAIASEGAEQYAAGIEVGVREGEEVRLGLEQDVEFWKRQYQRADDPPEPSMAERQFHADVETMRVPAPVQSAGEISELLADYYQRPTSLNADLLAIAVASEREAWIEYVKLLTVEIENTSGWANFRDCNKPAAALRARLGISDRHKDLRK